MLHHIAKEAYLISLRPFHIVGGADVAFTSCFNATRAGDSFCGTDDEEDLVESSVLLL